jgi:hypothetical protein
MAGLSDVEYFARLVEALDPWLNQGVIIGGWAHRLYRLHPLAHSSTTSLSEPLTPTSPSRSICPRRAISFARGCSKGTSAKN